MGKSSPTSGNGKERQTCRASDVCPSPSRRASTSTIDGSDRHGQGPQGHAVARRSPSRSRSTQRGRRARGHPSRTTSAQSRSLHGLTRTLVANMVIGVTEGYEKTPRDRRHRLPRRGQGQRTSSSPLGFSHPVTVDAPEGITFAVESPTKFAVAGHRQAAGRRGRREHPQDPQARAVQGQGRAVRGRGHPPQGRKGW